MAPRSASNYAYFLTGVRDTDAGEVPVGQVTIDLSHASVNLGANAALAHYDNTEKVVADINVGEDQFGIWVAGALRDGIDEAKLTSLKGAALSGDWRKIRGNMELVAALAVNTPGFPIPRVGYSGVGTKELALVAAGIVLTEQGKEEQVTDDENVEYVASIVESVIGRLEQRKSNEEKRAAVISTAAQVRSEMRQEALAMIRAAQAGGTDAM